MKKISVLGSTGSIGKQSLDVARLHKIDVKAIAANNNVKLLSQQAREFNVDYACIYNTELFKELKISLADTNVKVLCGMDGLCQIAVLNDVEILLNAVVGMVGLLPTLMAIKNKTNIALANKETLVAGGNLVMDAAREYNVKIFPVDSEHSAIFQCLQGNNREQLNKIILTASGGAFYGKTLSELKDVTIEQALKHPNWSMGNKITIDSATLMNKGLEFIEARWLFDLKPSEIEIVVHKQSVVHSAVEYADFSVIAQLGVPDMKIPIQYALLSPDRLPSGTKQLSLTDYGSLTFEKPDYETFVCLKTCLKASELGGAYPCIVNAANEESVRLFLDGKISFTQIGDIVNSALDYFKFREIKCYDDVMKNDGEARQFVEFNQKTRFKR